MRRTLRAECTAGPDRGESGAPKALRRREDPCETRCDCGSLLARWIPEGVELKCRRCKRRVVIPVSGRPPRAPPTT
jgi:hypothetical protein